MPFQGVTPSLPRGYFAILSQPKASTAFNQSRQDFGKRGTRDQSIALDQTKGLQSYEFMRVTLDLPTELNHNPAHEEEHPCRRPQKFTPTR
jgi:hypothetical protein